PHACWLYLFWQDNLWRELQVMDNCALRYVRLDYYRNAARFGLFEGADAATRKAEGRWLTDVWVPYKIAGAYQTGSLAPRIAFSKSQWDWEWVEKLETDGAALVEETLTLESLQAYSRQHGFEGAGELDDIQAATARLTG